jgi:hypothetical protein
MPVLLAANVGGAWTRTFNDVGEANPSLDGTVVVVLPDCGGVQHTCIDEPREDAPSQGPLVVVTSRNAHRGRVDPDQCCPDRVRPKISQRQPFLAPPWLQRLVPDQVDPPCVRPVPTCSQSA